MNKGNAVWHGFCLIGSVTNKDENMNRCNDWENLLRISNEDLEKTGYSLRIVEDEDGYYSCEVWKDGKFIDVYAENYWEDELSDLITDAFHHVNTYLAR